MARATAEEARKNERKAYLLRAGGATFDAIATELGYRDRAAAHKAWQRANARFEVDSDDEGVQLQLARLELLHKALWPKALKGEVAAVDRCLKISAEMRALRESIGGAGKAASAPTGEGDPVDQLAARRAQRYAEA